MCGINGALNQKSNLYVSERKEKNAAEVEVENKGPEWVRSALGA